MKNAKSVFWVAFGICALCLISMAAVLFAGTPEMSGGGFISLSPWLDAIFYGVGMVIPGAVMAFWIVQGSMAVRVRNELRYAAAYFLNLVILTAVVLMMGLLGLLNRFAPNHLPIYTYAAVMAAAYVISGFLWGRFYGGSIPGALVSCGILLAVLGVLAFSRLAWIDGEITYWTTRYPPDAVSFRYTDWVMDSWQGQGIAWLNLPASVIMGNYEYAYYEHIGINHGIPREVMTWLVCLCPPILFTASWLAGRLLRKEKNR